MIGIIFSTNADLKEVFRDFVIESEERVGSFCFVKGQLFDKEVVISNSCDSIQTMLDTYQVSKVIFIGLANSLRNDLHLSDIVIVKGVYLNENSDTDYIRCDRSTYKDVLNVCGEQYVFGNNVVHCKDVNFVSLEKYSSAVACNIENKDIVDVCSIKELPFVILNGIFKTPKSIGITEDLDRIHRRILKILKRYFDII